MDTSIPILLSKEDLKIAQKAAILQLNPARSKLAYLATLAILAGEHFLNYLGIKTGLKQSNGYNKQLFHYLDDLINPELFLPGFGRVIFPPVCPGDDSFSIFPEIDEDIIGYIPVRLDPLSEIPILAKALGFIPRLKAVELAKESTKIPISQLQDFDELIDITSPSIFDDEGEEKETFADSNTEEIVEEPSAPSKVIKIAGWRWKTQKREGWETPEEFLNRKASPKPKTSKAKSDGEFEAASGGKFKAGSGGFMAASGFTLPEPDAQKVKIIELGGQQLKLFVGLITKSGRLEDEVDISVILEPVDAEANLPKDLILELLSPDGEVETYDITDKETQKFIHVKITDELSFDYTVKVSLGDDEFTENIVMEKNQQNE